MSKIHGQASIRFNGQIYETEDDATLVVGGKKNNGRMIGQKFNYNQTVIPSQVTCRIPVGPQLSLKELQSFTDVEIIFESDMGKTWIIRDAVQQGEIALQGGEGNGTVELEFTGPPAEEVN